jgi:hypothetical protein
LHLPQRNSILRLSDRNYQFQQGIALSFNLPDIPDTAPQQFPIRQTTTKKKWHNLLDFLNRQLPQIPVWSDFTSFAQTALDYKEMLGHLPSHIDLFRREETPWDPAFQLYSGLVFVKNAANSSRTV